MRMTGHARKATPEEAGEGLTPGSRPTSRAGTTGSRLRRRSVECLRCGTARRVGAVEGECPSCGYLGWKPGTRRLALAPLHVR